MAMTLKRPSGFCECGCGGKTTIADKNNTVHGYVKGWPRRFINNHSKRLSPHEYLVDAETGCWVWQRGVTGAGYGKAYRHGQQGDAHRVYYTEHKGPIPEGLEIDHLCRNRRCVNPEHLEAVTPAVNQQRGENARLTREEVDEIRSLAAEGWVKADITRAYHLAAGYIYALLNERYWKTV